MTSKAYGIKSCGYHQFDELTKSLAQSVTRRAALKKFGVGLAGMALACFGLVNRSEADPCKPGGSHLPRQQSVLQWVLCRRTIW